MAFILQTDFHINSSFHIVFLVMMVVIELVTPCMDFIELCSLGLLFSLLHINNQV